MTKSEAIEFWGSQQAVADAIDIKQPSVAEWADGEHGIPPLRQIQLEKASRGRLKAHPSCYLPKAHAA